MSRYPTIHRLIFFVLLCGVILASSGVVVVLSTNQVSNTQATKTTDFRWEPTAASGARWAHGWYEFPPGSNSFVSSWNGGWSSQYKLTAPNGDGLLDLNLNYDSFRSRFVFAAVELTIDPSIWYGYSTDSTGTAWVVVTTAALPGTQSPGGWDYPSIGVDASGRIIVGAVALNATNGPAGYYAAVSTNGSAFFSPTLVTAGTSPGFGQESRVVATNNVFHAFITTVNSNFLPTAVTRYQSSNGTSWAGPYAVASFTAPSNNSPSGTAAIFYAPLPTAQGYTNGLWTVAMQVNNAGFNNAYLCTSDRGCGLVNSYGTDQFLVGTSVSGDSGYWISYYTYMSAPRTLPLKTQAIYCPTGLSCIGTDANKSPGIQPTSWYFTSSRCKVPSSCYAAGDFQTVTSNPVKSASAPFIQQSTHQNDLFQNFVEDPQVQPGADAFLPNTIWFPLGTDISSRGVAAVSDASPGLPLSLTTGVPVGAP
jgi:hypothetical protein